jgi:hypothetical protein
MTGPSVSPAREAKSDYSLRIRVQSLEQLLYGVGTLAASAITNAVECFVFAESTVTGLLGHLTTSLVRRLRCVVAFHGVPLWCKSPRPFLVQKNGSTQERSDASSACNRPLTRPLTRPATAGESADAGHPLPRGGGCSLTWRGLLSHLERAAHSPGEGCSLTWRSLFIDL